MVRLEPDGASLGVEVHQLLLQKRDDRARFLTESKGEPGGMTRALAFSQAGSFYGRKHRNRPLGRLLLRFAMWPSSAGLSIIPRQLAVWPLME